MIFHALPRSGARQPDLDDAAKTDLVKPNAALHDVGDIVGTALQRTSKMLARHLVEIDLAADLPMLPNSTMDRIAALYREKAAPLVHQRW